MLSKVSQLETRFLKSGVNLLVIYEKGTIKLFGFIPLMTYEKPIHYAPIKETIPEKVLEQK